MPKASAVVEAWLHDLYVGIKDRSQLGAHLIEKGATPLAIDTRDLAWEKTITYSAEHLRQKLHSEFWAVPNEVCAEIRSQRCEIGYAQQPEGEDTVETMRPYLVAEAFTVRK